MSCDGSAGAEQVGTMLSGRMCNESICVAKSIAGDVSEFGSALAVATPIPIVLS